MGSRTREALREASLFDGGLLRRFFPSSLHIRRLPAHPHSRHTHSTTPHQRTMVSRAAFLIPSSTSDQKRETSSLAYSAQSTPRGAQAFLYSPTYGLPVEPHSISLEDVARWRQRNEGDRLRPPAAGSSSKDTLNGYRCVLILLTSARSPQRRDERWEQRLPPLPRLLFPSPFLVFYAFRRSARHPTPFHAFSSTPAYPYLSFACSSLPFPFPHLLNDPHREKVDGDWLESNLRRMRAGGGDGQWSTV